MDKILDSKEAILLDNNKSNTLWSDAISKEMTALERLRVFQLYSPKTFENKDGWQYAT